MNEQQKGVYQLDRPPSSPWLGAFTRVKWVVRVSRSVRVRDVFHSQRMNCTPKAMDGAKRMKRWRGSVSI